VPYRRPRWRDEIAGEFLEASTPPDGSAHRQSDPAHRQVDSENRQVDSENRLVDSENRQVDPENRQVDSENRQVDPENRQVDPENRQVDSENRLIDSENRQVDPENRQVDPENRQVDSENRLIDSENRQVDPENRQVDPENRQSDPENRLVGPARRQLDPAHHQRDPDNPPPGSFSPPPDPPPASATICLFPPARLCNNSARTPHNFLWNVAMKKNALRALCLLASAAAACKSTVTTSVIAPGAQCPNGGLAIRVDNGAPQIVCNGTNGSDGDAGTLGIDGGNGINGDAGANGANAFVTLVRTTVLAVGDLRCAAGGEEIQSGLDNGSGGGIANDGILQPGEVTSTSYICDDSGMNVGGYTAPGGAAGTDTMLARGGASDAGTGGAGGQIAVRIPNGTEGGHIRVFATGSADPSFTVPPMPTVELGPVGVVIASATTVQADDALAPDAGPGTLFTDDAGTLYVIGDGDAGAEAVTGVMISAQVTVTLEPHQLTTLCGENLVTQQVAALTVAGPVFNAGTLTVDSSMISTDGSTPALSLDVESFYGLAGSSLVNDGPAGGTLGGPRRASSNPLQLPGLSSGGVWVAAQELVNQGSISANGGDGSSGGNGGFVYLGTSRQTFASQCGIVIGSSRAAPATREARRAESPSAAGYSTGAISARGGAGLNGGGGRATGASLDWPADLYTSSSIDVSGGGGTTAGGSGGTLSLIAGDGQGGSLYSSGPLSASGGDVDPSCVISNVSTCAAGSGVKAPALGDGVYLHASNGGLVHRAPIVARGGSSAQGPGGAGTSIAVHVDNPANSLVPTRDIDLSGSADVSGGAGVAAGGSAGQILVQLDPGDAPSGQQITLYGYALLDASGGAGLNGGAAGSVQMSNFYFNPSLTGPNATHGPGPGGAVINQVSWVARGGDGDPTVGTGGRTGNLTLGAITPELFSGQAIAQVYNSGNLAAIAGSGATGGFEVESIHLIGSEGVTNSGTLSARAGESTVGVGGYPGVESIVLESEAGVINNSGTLDARGADGATAGGAGGYVELDGMGVIESGQILAPGGAASGSGGQGGLGGTADLQSASGQSSVLVAAPAGIDVAGGAAASGTAGAAGSVQIDGWDVTPEWTH